MDKFNYDKAEADLYDSGCHHSEEIYDYRSEKGIRSFMRENGLNPDKYYERDNTSKGGSSSGNDNDSGGCFLTTACTEAKGLPDNCRELETLRHFRDNYMMNVPEGKADIAHYYKTAPSVYAARTATAARAFCPPSPVTAHGHCPANYDILGMARQ